MGSIQITLPDETVRELPAGSSGLDVALLISEGLARAAVAVTVNDVLQDLTRPIEGDARVRILTFRDAEGREVFMHSAAHLLAQAVTELFPDAKSTIGPPVDEGFYYDFDHAPFTEEDLGRIEVRMKELVKAKLPVERMEMTRAEALEVFAGNPYKVEMIEALEGGITAYRQGGFIDLCRGPHVPGTGQIKAVKVLKVAGAYWRGDAANQQLQRIYAIAFPDKKQLKEHLHLLEEAKKRDHRRLGKELDLFSFQTVGPGFPFWHDNGMRLKEAITTYWRMLHRRDGYEEISTPVALDESLWQTSGHANYYRENMYFTDIDERSFAIKPMNCPGGVLVYKDRRRSYRELPLRIAELGLVHRHEMSGVLHGLFRVRSFTQDDAHIYCTEAQLEDEVIGVVNLVLEMYRTFGFEDVEVELSTPSGEAHRRGRCLGSRRDDPRGGAQAHGPRVQDQRRRRCVLRPQDRLPHPGLHEPLLAMRYGPGGLRPPLGGAVQHDLRGRGRAATPAGHGAPGDPGQPRALHRDPHRALRREVPAVALPAAGPGDPCVRRVPRLREGGHGSAAGCGDRRGAG